jgi:enoyl-CoA hydratase/carnithine racemase
MSNNVTVLPTFMEEDEPGKHLDAQLNKALNYNNKGGSQSPFDSAGRKTDFIKSILNETFGNGHASPYVSCGYDARYVYESGLLGGGGGGSGGMTDTKQRIDTELLSPMMKLSNSVRGSTTHHHNLDGVGGGGRKSKVPIISFPHGLVTDGGYSLLLSSYVLATYSTSYRVLHPLRGLAFDPCGLSYLLPRIGQEFHQASSNYSMSIAAMLSLTGYEANAQDMIATGLATHYVGGPYKLNLLERALMDINSREYQNLHPKPSGLYGREDDWGGETDINLHFHNVAVGNLIQNLSEYDAAGADEYGCYLSDMLDDETGLYLKDKDPSLTLAEDRVQLYGELESDLVNWAATFASAFANENTVPGILARLREIAATKAQFVNKLGYEEDVEVADMAQSLINNMERRSPLALCVTNRLLRLGAEHGETMESCMERERQSQAKLYMKADGDYVRWARSGCGVGLVYMPHGSASLVKEKEDTYAGGWTHKSVGDVTVDEIDEIVGM